MNILPNYIYKAKIVNIVDGDTFDADIDLGFHLKTRQRLRLNIYDTFELNSSNADERVLAAQARDFCKSTIEGADVMIKTIKTDAFGRYLAEVFLTYDGEETNLGQLLFDKGLAVLYKRN